MADSVPDKLTPAGKSTSPTRPQSMFRSVLRRLFSRNPLHWVGAAMAFGAVAALGGFATAASGVADLSAIPPHPEGWARLLHYSSERAFAAHAGSVKEAPDEPLENRAVIMRGAAQFAIECSNCHGAPGYGQSPVALSMRPEPPGLEFAAKNYSKEQLYYVVQNGASYTSMPAWPVTNRPDEIWSLVAFLKAMPNMTREQYVELARGDARDASRLDALTIAPAQRSDATITPFVPNKTDRPYFPGDPQDPFATDKAIAFPRIGFMNVGMGENPVRECVACHGLDGAGRAGGSFPNLTLQSPQYLYSALKAYAVGQRQSGVMWPIAASLSDDEMRALATRFGAGVPKTSHGENEIGGALEKTGENVANGVGADGKLSADTQVGVVTPMRERCTSCHIQDVYLDRVIPRIDGQNAAYIRSQMRAFRRGGRGDTTSYNPMVADSHNLTDADIVGLGAYYAGRIPDAKIK